MVLKMLYQLHLLEPIFLEIEIYIRGVEVLWYMQPKSCAVQNALQLEP